MNAGLFERLHFFRGSSLPTCDDGARVAHAASWRRGLTGDKRDDRFRDVFFCKRRGFFFGGAANLANHHDAVSLFVFLKKFERVNMSSANNRIATYANRG